MSRLPVPEARLTATGRFNEGAPPRVHEGRKFGPAQISKLQPLVSNDPSRIRSSIRRFRWQPPARCFHAGVGRSCHVRTFGSGARPCSKNSSLPLGRRTRRASRSASAGSATEHIGRQALGLALQAVLRGSAPGGNRQERTARRSGGSARELGTAATSARGHGCKGRRAFIRKPSCRQTTPPRWPGAVDTWQ